MKTTKILTILFMFSGMIAFMVTIAEAALIGTAFTYQGHLLERGQPTDGLYDFQFKLYDAIEAGIQKGPTIDFNDLDVIDGYFCVELDFGSDVFNGDARWLEMTVAHADGSDPCTLSPRGEVTTTPYALYAVLANSVAIPLSLSGSQPGSHVMKVSNVSGVNGSIGVLGEATAEGAGLSNYGGYFTAEAGSGSGVYGEASNMGDVTNYGGYFRAWGSLGRGVYGEATSATDMTNYGGYFQAAGEQGQGVYGKASNVGDVQNYGGYFKAEGKRGRGVYGEASNSTGTLNYGGYFTAAGSSGRGVYGMATGDYGAGVYGYATSSAGSVAYGVYGHVTGSGKAVCGIASGAGGDGVYGEGFNGGYFTSPNTYYGVGVFAYASGDYGIGVQGGGGDYDFYAAGPGTNYGAASSIRWKRDIRPIDEPLGKVMNLRGVYFNWDIEHGGQHDVGMIAEEVGQVLPEIVNYEENGIDTTGMDYSKLTPLLTEAIKELKAENDALKKRIEVLEAKIQQVSILSLEK